jgi:hypothetical protein
MDGKPVTPRSNKAALTGTLFCQGVECDLTHIRNLKEKLTFLPIMFLYSQAEEVDSPGIITSVEEIIAVGQLEDKVVEYSFAIKSVK